MKRKKYIILKEIKKKIIYKYVEKIGLIVICNVLLFTGYLSKQLLMFIIGAIGLNLIILFSNIEEKIKIEEEEVILIQKEKE